VLVQYYSQWAAAGNAHAPRYRRVEGVGSVDEIKQRVFGALA
jgi:adenylate kinase